MSHNTSNRMGGRILLCERNVDKKSPIIGVGINNSKLGEAYKDEYQDTLYINIQDKTRMDYHRCIIVISNYWEEYCPVYYSKNNPRRGGGGWGVFPGGVNCLMRRALLGVSKTKKLQPKKL